ncbi:NCS1 nucleoside transporter family [Phanerochaete sordida]|uniref:NCS1 nucleoside transporter family n=1 Tax=Phanerochaete sordida TaxID=48140 RepID=A0A9P3GH09_9APHY|nr:NCS1 nucleoside transporter family [Phanerochaete sordida]
MGDPWESPAGEAQQPSREGSKRSGSWAWMGKESGMATIKAGPGATAYSNVDVLPLPPDRRTWGKTTFVFFWISTAINIAEWSGAAASLALGLTVGQAILVNAISTIIITIALVVNGHGGGKWHVPFAIINRASWGMYGGQMVKVLIGSLWPSFYNMKNHFPSDIGMETNDFVGFIIFYVLSVPIFMLKPERYRLPAILSSFAAIVAAFSIFIWALAKQRGGGPLFSAPAAVTGVPRLRGAQLGWVMMRCITSGIGGWAGGILYQSDFSRYARRSGDQLWGQIFAIPVCLLGSNILGIVATSCARGFYPEEPLLWKIYDLLAAVQRHEGPGARAAVFFAALAFVASQLSVTVIACGVVGGMDLAALLPRYLNIRRGSFVVAIVGICINPWRILNTANSFISAMSSYAIFLAPLTGIMVADYHFLRGRRLKLSHLYMPNTSSDYWFWHGINWRAPIAWVLGVWPHLPGFAATVTPDKVQVNSTWINVYYLSWPLAFCISASVWMALNTLWPPPGVGEVDDESDDVSVDEKSPGFEEGL